MILAKLIVREVLLLVSFYPTFWKGLPPCTRVSKHVLKAEICCQDDVKARINRIENEIDRHQEVSL